MIQLLEIVENPFPAGSANKFTLREVYVSPEHIVMVREDYNLKRIISEQINFNSQDAATLTNPNMKFSKITVNRGTTGQDMSVAGSVEMIYSKIEESKGKKKVLRG